MPPGGRAPPERLLTGEQVERHDTDGVKIGACIRVVRIRKSLRGELAGIEDDAVLMEHGVQFLHPAELAGHDFDLSKIGGPLFAGFDTQQYFPGARLHGTGRRILAGSSDDFRDCREC